MTMPAGVQEQVPLLTEGFGGANTALQFSQLSREQSPSMQNAWMPKIGAIGKRPGTIPITATALGAAISRLMLYKGTPTNVDPDILAASGTTLYKFNGTTAFVAQTMTNALNTSDIYDVDFTNSVLTSIKFITDQSDMKKYNGTAVSNIAAAADDPSPNPANDLLDVNAKDPKYCWTFSGHIFVSPGSNEVFYSKRYQFDYFPTVQWFLLIRDNDFVNGCGIAFNNVCLIPMRRGWAILTGTNFDNFDASTFLNTVSGVIAPKSIARATYPTGQQTIIYLSDDGVHEIYDTTILDSGTRQYATRALMKDKIDFTAIGLTESEKEAAVGYFDAPMSLYFLSFQKSSVNYTYVFDVRNGEWYPDWLTFNAKSYIRSEDTIYFAGSTGHLHKFDLDLYSDWNESTQATATPVHFRRYSPLLALEHTGYASYWDYYLIEQKVYNVPSSLDIYAIFTYSTTGVSFVFDTSSAVWDETDWDVAEWANEDFTEPVNEPRRYVYKKKSKYNQMLWDSPRDEPLEVYWDQWLGRLSGQ
jgi:hypothetical protein